MKDIIKISLITLLIAGISACDKDSKTAGNKIAESKALITINKTLYHLPIQVCNKPRTDTFKRQSIIHYSIVAQDMNNKTKTVLYVNGVKGKKESFANYKLELNQNGSVTTLLGKIPYESFDGKKLNYKGQTKVDKKSYPIEISVNCK